MANRILTRLAVLALSGCAICREHPIACGVGAAIVAGSIATTIALHHRQPLGGTAGCIEYYEQRGATPAEAQHDCR